MARVLKPMKIDTIFDRKTGDHIDVMFDRNNHRFFAECGTDRVEDPTAEGCHVKARQLLEMKRSFKWEKFIWVEKPEKDRTTYGGRLRERHRARLEFEFWRGEISTKPDGKKLYRPFMGEDGLMDDDKEDLAPEHKESRIKWNQERRERGDDIESYHPYDSHIQLPYHEETWLALVAVKDRIEKARAQLEEVVSAGDFEKRLKLVAANLKLLPEKT
jgi:hypothetical protein